MMQFAELGKFIIGRCALVGEQSDGTRIQGEGTDERLGAVACRAPGCQGYSAMACGPLWRFTAGLSPAAISAGGCGGHGAYAQPRNRLPGSLLLRGTTRMCGEWM